MQVAHTILDQLGGRQFLALTGARDLVGGDDRLTFSLPRRAGCKINKVRVTLTPRDTYRVEFLRVRRQRGVPTVDTVSEYDDVCCDMLRDLFERKTGLYTSLRPRAAS